MTLFIVNFEGAQVQIICVILTHTIHNAVNVIWILNKLQLIGKIIKRKLSVLLVEGRVHCKKKKLKNKKNSAKLDLITQKIIILAL